MTAHSVLNVHAAPEWGNSELHRCAKERSRLWDRSKHREFDAAVDDAAVAQIMKAKTEPATTRIVRLLDRLSAYSFNLYYVKGRDMILSDYLSRHRQKDLDPSELIPISFCCLKAYMSFIDDKIGGEIFCVKTKSKCKSNR